MQISKIEQLSNLLSQYPWFKGVEKDSFGRLVVYSDSFSSEVFSKVPENFENERVLLHFAASKSVNKDNYITDLRKNQEIFLEEPVCINTVAEPYVKSSSDEEEADQCLNWELESLNNLFDYDILYHIFFEVHDGKNAITQLSNTYKDARLAMEDLYEIYGFDMLHTKLVKLTR